MERFRREIPTDPSLLAHHLDRGCEWEDPTADEALG